jgi:hypothetical protein
MMVNSSQNRDLLNPQLYIHNLDVWERVLGQSHPNVTDALYGLAKVNVSLLEFARAEAHLRRAKKIIERSLELDHPDLADTLTDLAQVLRATARGNRVKTEEAKSLESRAKAIRAKHSGMNKRQGDTDLRQSIHTLR